MKAKRLSEMKPAERGVIGHIDSPEAAMALVEMGCWPGEEVTVAHVAPGDGPMAITSGGRKVALRRKAAEMLWMLPVAVQSTMEKVPQEVMQLVNG
ncbi:MAG: FeoA family protein [Flavobacteriales bacterium]|jgi:ferrous iron transport protein A